ncbi:(SSU ribosomal protein S18P)-alanine acetyltransferase [Stanieria cyanosphaera PCC 7437]|uniref:(SSU ribosomal protein S18P)-alanine acetyltransferase n=1 Tax=Stanieria cyanosphaera (strain ATCC 29371 / PCC 7437) TaxID=111780 RepID=K9XQQ9_STAC7|nr:ribosomal protein S18-alanine N-acetyltransferase [Stanieria cyanosphaera]AFZ33997.1 (SSU ribosomal protein S18P)-alanine acetyltransferase [Stanieria cyanosphaera PCC 7437]
MKFLIINSAKEQQLTEIIEIDQLCFGGLWSKEGYQREIDSPNSSLLTLVVKELQESNGDSTQVIAPSNHSLNLIKPNNNPQLIGIGCFWAILEEAHITLLGVKPNYQRQGLGKLLLYALLQQAIERKLERATLEVRASNQAAINLYEKFGFRLAGRRKKYYAKTGEDALIFWRGGLAEQQFKNDLANWKTEISNRLAGEYVLIEQKN